MLVGFKWCRRVSAKQINAEAVCEFQYIRLTSNSSIFVLRRAFYGPERHGGFVHLVMTLPSFAQNIPKPVEVKEKKARADKCDGAKRLKHLEGTANAVRFNHCLHLAQKY